MLVQKPEAVVVWMAVLVASTAAQLGLNEEPSLRKRPRHFLDLQIQRTREGLERHVDCNVDCEQRSRDPVCGTNGHTYDSICDLDKDICKKVKVRLKHVGECSLAEKCLDQRAAKQEQVANGERVYVPTCLADGSFAPVQCHNFTLYCWCSRLDGNPIPHTIQKDTRPECSAERGAAPTPDPPAPGKCNTIGQPASCAEQILKSLSTATPAAPPSPPPPQPGLKRCSGRTRRAFIKEMGHHLLKEFKRERNARGVPEDRLLRKAVRWKFSRLDRNGDKQLRRREFRGLRKTVRKHIKPKKCAKKFPRLCDADGSNSLSEEEWINCFAVPRRNRGNRKNCRNGSCQPNSSGNRPPKPTCEYEHRSTLEAERAGNNSILILACQPNGKYEPVQCYKDLCFCVDEWSGYSLDGTMVKNGTPDCSRPMPHAREWPGCTGEAKAKFIQDLKKYLLSKVEGGDRSAGADSSTQSVEEFAATYHFRSLDRNNNNFLEKKEKRLAKRFLKSNPKLKQCGRKITKYCDVDRDDKVSLEEWVACVVVKQNDTGDSARGGVGQDNIRRIEENPIRKFLISEDEVLRLKNRNW